MDSLSAKILSIVNQTADSALLNNNANKASERIPVMRDMIAGEVCKDIAHRYILPKHISEAHKAGDIHFHDLDYSPVLASFNCMLVDLDFMLTNGFKLGSAHIDTPKSINTACAITAQVIAQVASHTYGGTSINRIDEVLAPYVKLTHDKHINFFMNTMKLSREQASFYADIKTNDDVKDSIQGLSYEINTIYSSNGQTPFVTFGFGLGTSKEATLIQEAILKERILGLGKNGLTPVFPKLIFSIKDGINHKEGDINYHVKKLAIECASKRMYPDIINVDKLTEITGGFKTAMGCRSFLHEWENAAGEKVYDGRNNLGVVSINLPRIAIQSKGDKTDFYNRLDTALDMCHDALKIRIDRFKNVKADVAPILYTEGAMGVKLKPTDNITDLFESGRASISLGYIGINEMVNAMFTSKTHIFDDEEKQEFALEVLNKLNARCKLWKEESGYHYSLYSTPSESLCDRFLNIDLNDFGIIKGVTDKEYYTNSFHLDVAYKTSPFKKIDFEAPYQLIASGGFIGYAELSKLKNYMDVAIESLWDYSFNKLGYMGLNIPIDTCLSCGFTGDITLHDHGAFECPSCGNDDVYTMDITKRVCGYIGKIDKIGWNPGKTAELKNRTKHV